MMSYINLARSEKIIRSMALNSAVGANATLVIYDGIHPDSPDSNTTANALVTFTCGATTFGVTSSVSNTVTLTSSAFAPQYCTANGIASWARISDVNGTPIIDLDVGTSNASIVMNSLNLVTGLPVQVINITILEQ